MEKPILDENADISNINFDSRIFYENNILTESFIERYQNIIVWWYLSVYQKLSETFIEKHQDKVDWYWISLNQSLSENFIDKHATKVNWMNISYSQKMSNEFIAKNLIDKDQWPTLCKNYYKYLSKIKNLSFERNKVFYKYHLLDLYWVRLNKNVDQESLKQFLKEYIKPPEIPLMSINFEIQGYK